MQKLVLYSTLAFSLALIVFACSKDKYQDKPTVEVTSINPGQVPLNSPLEIKMQFTDKQGDLDSIFLHKLRLNSKAKPLIPNNDFKYKLPTFPDKTKGEIKVTLQYALDVVSAQKPDAQAGAPNGYEPDTIAFQIVLKDKKGHTSDTTVTDKIVVERVP
ncbi:hypothetical protein A3860_13415 [Niastella vici]|uniref:DUF4625 domain-containing protein n=1 Tax=Niastella vici TaxID=1703345 RepID=A0A1V9G791_9BACT|nr:hypothetical protein [Niastella vici]OQP66483.1 hypothetical protein A3860_13415 [Niastella vici]